MIKILKNKQIVAIGFVYALNIVIPTASHALTPSLITPATKPATAKPVNQRNIAVIRTVNSNPAAINVSTGTGAIQRYVLNKLGIQDDHGISLKGAWLGDINQLFSGGIRNADRTTSNSVLILDLTADMEKLIKWDGGLLGAEFLQVNTQNTNVQAGSIQGYNSLPGPPPLNRSELYQLWFRQALFNKKLYIRVGKTVPTYDFTNIIKPINAGDKALDVSAVTSLLYTPIFVFPPMLGVIPGYYNSAYGITVNFTPVEEWYFSYGMYDGNLANGTQTGLTGPNFNGNYFHVAETGVNWLLGKHHLPGTIAIGAWQQRGLIVQPPLSEHKASGAYLFGTQRLWARHPGADHTGILGFYQCGINNSNVLPMTQFVGAGLTAFGLIANRFDDSIGIGASVAWLNNKSFSRRTESMYQAYYQAKVISLFYLEPGLSYIPTPGASPKLSAAWAGTLRAIVLF